MFKDTGKISLSSLPQARPSVFFELKDSKFAFNHMMSLLEAVYGRCAVEHKMPEHCYVNYHIAAVLRKIGIRKNDLSGIGNLKVLDLACGSVNTIDKPKTSGEARAFEPWLARFFKLAGAARVAGVDIEEQGKNERFENFVSDLSKKGSLDFFSDSSFNLVVCCGLVSFTGDASNDASIRVLEGMKIPEMIGMRQEIFRQAFRVLEEGGLFVCDCSPEFKYMGKYGAFMKKEGKLERVG